MDIFSWGSSMVAGLVDLLTESIQFLILEPIAPGTTPLERVLYGNGWGTAQVLSISATFVLLAISVAWHKQLGRALQSLLLALLLSFFGGALFFRFVDGVRAFSRDISLWMINAGGQDIRFDIPKNGDMFASYLTLVGVGGAGSVLLIMMIIMSMALIVCTTVFLPLLVLIPVSNKAKWLFDWVASIMLVGLLLGGPVVVGIIQLGRALRHRYGDQHQQIGGMVLVAACIMAIVVLVTLTRASHHTITKQTDKLKAMVNGSVDTKVTNKPSVNLNQAATNHVTATLPAATQQSIPSAPGISRRAYHEGAARATTALVGKLASRSNPVAATAAVVGTAVVNHHKTKAGGIPWSPKQS